MTFDAGQTTKTISVLVNGDRAGELNETFTVNLGLAAGNAVLGDSQGVGTIVDDEPRVGINSVTKNEGNSGTTPFVFTVSLSAASRRSGQPELRHGERLREIAGGLRPRHPDRSARMRRMAQATQKGGRAMMQDATTRGQHNTHSSRAFTAFDTR